MSLSSAKYAVSESHVKTAAQWGKAGLSRQRIRTLASSGELVRIRPGVYATRQAVEKAAEDARFRHALAVKAVTVSIGDAVASHYSAAGIHALELLNRPAEGVVTLIRPDARKHDRAGSKGVHFRSGDLPPEHVVETYGVRITTIMRTVADLARDLPFIDGVVVADSALRKFVYAKTEYQSFLVSCASWPGVKQARRAIAFSDENAGSVLESCLRVRLHEWGFPPPETQAAIDTGSQVFYVDFVYERYKTIIEADGLSKFSQAKDIRKQFHRDRLLRDAGYKVVHVTWQELFYDAEVVINRIRKAFTVTTAF